MRGAFTVGDYLNPQDRSDEPWETRESAVTRAKERSHHDLNTIVGVWDEDDTVLAIAINGDLFKPL